MDVVLLATHVTFPQGKEISLARSISGPPWTGCSLGHDGSCSLVRLHKGLHEWKDPGSGQTVRNLHHTNQRLYKQVHQ